MARRGKKPTYPNATRIVIRLLCLLLPLFAVSVVADEQVPPGSTIQGETRQASPSPGTPADSQAKSGAPADSQAKAKGESAFPGPRPLSLVHLLLGMALGFGTGFARMLYRFRRFWGLGILSNLWSWLFLVLIAASSGVSYMLVERSANAMWGLMFESVQNDLTTLIGIFGSPIVGNLTTLLGRLSRRSPQDTGAKELDDAKSSNLLFEQIRQSITNGLHREVTLLARRYDWSLIRDAICHLVDNEITVGSLPAAEGETALQFIRAIEASPDPRMDFDNKYRALNRALRVTSFRQLRSRLEQGTKEVV